MALAILELVDFEPAQVRFNIDTGTNRYYQLKIGRNVRRKSGIDWVDEVFFSTPVSLNEVGGSLFNSSKDISLPIKRFDKEKAYVQLFSFKTPGGKSPAFSRVLQVPGGLGGLPGSGINLAPSLSIATSMKTTDPFQAARRIPCRSYKEVYARQASLEDLLAGIVKVAAPAVLNLLGGGQPEAQPKAPSGAAGSNENAGLANLLTQLLNTILGGIPGKPGPVVSEQKSLYGPGVHANLFLNPQNAAFSQPFFWQAILQAVAGPIIQMLPQLLNSANQRRIQLKQADNKLVSDILSDVNRRMLLEQLLQVQRQAPAAAQPGDADLNQLIQLLQQVPAASQPGATGVAPQAPVATASLTQSLPRDEGHAFTLSSKAVVSFVTADAMPWNGLQKVLFAKNQGLQLKIQLNVAEPVPKSPLPKAILKIIFKDGSNQSVWHEKSFKQKDVLPNRVMVFPFGADELSHLPAHKPITLLAEMRWLSAKTGKEYKALGASEIILVNKYFLKEQGQGVSTERELTDMKQFRPFWNKVWEAPSLDMASGGRHSEKKYLWELDVNAKYSVFLSPDHEANGLMETKILQQQPDEQSLSQRVEGRMKAGIELSLTALNKLMPLWDGETILDHDKLEAFTTEAFAKNNGGEFTYNFKLKGRAGQRGMIWVVPIFKLYDFTLNTIQKTDDSGQVVEVAEEKVRFPLPTSARVIGLKSQ